MYVSSTVILLLLATIASGIPLFQIPHILSVDETGVQAGIFGFNAEARMKGAIDSSGVSGSMYAQANTPYGQKAVAGLGGKVGNKRLEGQLYSGASDGVKGVESGAQGFLDKNQYPWGRIFSNNF